MTQTYQKFPYIQTVGAGMSQGNKKIKEHDVRIKNAIIYCHTCYELGKYSKKECEGLGLD